MHLPTLDAKNVLLILAFYDVLFSWTSQDQSLHTMSSLYIVDKNEFSVA